MTMTRFTGTKPITAYRNGVAYFNARLANAFGKGEYIITRGKGYYYVRGEGYASHHVPSIFWNDMRIDTPSERVALVHQIAVTIRDIHELRCED